LEARFTNKKMARPPADEKIWEALEVCRPDRDESPDPALERLVQELTDHPEIRQRYERIRDFDAQLADLFLDVPIPQGLAEQIKATINPEGEPGGRPDAVPSVLLWSAAAGETRPSETGIPRRRVISRRWFYVAGGALLGSAVALLVMLFIGLGKTEPYTHEAACEEAIRFFEHDSAVKGILFENQTPPEEFAFSRSIIESRGIRWRKVASFLGREGVAFDLPSGGGGRATLYVVPLAIEGISSLPSPYPFTTGGCAADVWQEEGHLYVLVVEGDRQNFNSFLKPRSPLA
jgi:hypothetical protein